MIKNLYILTALGIQSLYEKLKNIKEINLYQKDIQYREGVLEILKKNNKINLIIIYEKLPGEISFDNLIKEINKINNEIKIIFLLENKNEKLEKILIKENIKNIFYNNKINFDEFILRIKNINFSEKELLKKEIEKLNEIIYKKNKELNKYKDFKKSYKNIKSKKNYKKNNILIITEINFNNLKIITDKINYKKEYLKLNNINKQKNELDEKIKYCKKIIFILNLNFEEIKKINKIINLIKIKYLIKDEIIYVLFIENKNKKKILIRDNSINIYIIKNIFKDYNVLGKINLNNKKLRYNKKIINKISNI